MFLGASVGFVLLMGRYAVRVYLSVPADRVLLFGPLVYPLFSLDAASGVLLAETDLVDESGAVVVLAILWGAVSAILLEPSDVGVGIVSVVCGLAAVALAFVASDGQLRLGEAAPWLDDAVLRQAAAQARATFWERRRPMTVTCDEFTQRDRDNDASRLEEMMDVGAQALAAERSAQRAARATARRDADRWLDRASSAQLAVAADRARWHLEFCFPWEPEAFQPGLGGVDALRRGGRLGFLRRRGLNAADATRISDVQRQAQVEVEAVRGEEGGEGGRSVDRRSPGSDDSSPRRFVHGNQSSHSIAVCRTRRCRRAWRV